MKAAVVAAAPLLLLLLLSPSASAVSALVVEEYGQIVVSASPQLVGVGAVQFVWLRDGGMVDAAPNARTLVLEAALRSDAGRYSLNVTYTDGSFRMLDVADLSVEYPPELLTQPKTLTTAAPGSTVTLSVVADAVPAPTFEWRLDDVALAQQPNSDTLTLAAVSESDVGRYTVLACNKLDCRESRPATVRILTAPAFNAEPPADVAVVLGNQLHLELDVRGIPFPEVQWYFEGQALAGQQSATLFIPRVGLSHEGQYYAVLTNTVGSKTGPVTQLDVLEPPTFSLQPQAATVNFLDTFIAFVSVDGDAPFSYRWTRNGETVRGEDTPTLRIEDVTPSDAGVYQVHVTNIAGTAASDAITMTVRMPPAITSHPASKNGVVGRSIEFAVSVADPSQPDLEFVWQVDGIDIVNATERTFHHTFDAEGVFGVRVLVTNPAGAVLSNPAQVKISAAASASGTSDGGAQSFIIPAIAAVAGIVVLVIVVVLVRRRRRRSEDNAPTKWMGTLLTSESAPYDEDAIRGRFLELCPGPDYEDPEGETHAVMRPPDLDSSRLELRKRLASGGAIEVRSGLLRGDASTPDVPVMIKALRTTGDSAMCETFMLEAFMYHNLQHKNIVSLLGVATSGPTWAMALELPSIGRLKQLLQRQTVSEASRRRYAYDVADAMAFLASHRVIHRALMASHVIVTNRHVAKIAEFGYVRRLAKDVEEYDSASGYFALPWAPLEAVTQNKFVAKSDVWSFGVLLYEIWTKGAEPYSGPEWQSNMVNRLKDGYRLAPPAGVTYDMYKLMIDCWNPDASLRPSFREIMETLKTAKSAQSAVSSVLLSSLQDTYLNNYIEIATQNYSQHPVVDEVERNLPVSPAQAEENRRVFRWGL